MINVKINYIRSIEKKAHNEENHARRCLRRAGTGAQTTPSRYCSSEHKVQVNPKKPRQNRKSLSQTDLYSYIRKHNKQSKRER